MKKLIILILLTMSIIFLYAQKSRPSVEIEQHKSASPDMAQAHMVQAKINWNPKFIEGNNAFAFKMYKELNKEHTNLFFSPYSLSTIFAMLYAGAGGQTARQIASTFNFTQPTDTLNYEFKQLQDNIVTTKKFDTVQLKMANGLFLAKRFQTHFRKEFLAMAKDNYDAEIIALNFRDKVNSAATINKWVDDKTNHTITKIVKPGTLDSLTVSVLTNAIYFKGEWAVIFMKRFTKEDNFFYQKKGNVKASQSVMMMDRQAFYKYLDTGTLKVIQLPYVGEISMIILLPQINEDISILESQLNNTNLNDWLSRMSFQTVNVFLPKFRIDESYDGLIKNFRHLGMTTPFDIRNANFSKMIDNPQPYVHDLVHKTFVSVDELGTEAAAITEAGMFPKGGREPGEIHTFRADHPFIFMIRHNTSGSILFLGKIENPGNVK